MYGEICTHTSRPAAEELLPLQDDVKDNAHLCTCWHVACALSRARSRESFVVAASASALRLLQLHAIVSYLFLAGAHAGILQLRIGPHHDQSPVTLVRVAGGQHVARPLRVDRVCNSWRSCCRLNAQAFVCGLTGQGAGEKRCVRLCICIHADALNMHSF